jgi:site-specific DNA recombinase
VEDCTKYCEGKKYDLIDTLVEDVTGVSGAVWSDHIEELITRAERREFDVLVVREMDRLARGIAKQLTIEDELKSCGIKIEYVLESYADSPEGSLGKNVKAAVAEYQRLKITQRMTRGRLNRVKTAKKILVGSRPPLGYDLNEARDNLVVNEEQAGLVRLIFNLYVEKKSLHGVVKALQKMEIPARKRNPDKGYCVWAPSSISHILNNDTYRGVWYYGKRKRLANGKRVKTDPSTWLKLPVPAIIDQHTWKWVQDTIEQTKRQSRGNKKHPYLLGGMLKCSCGYNMVGYFDPSSHTPGLKYFKYGCPAHRKQSIMVNKCDMKPFNRDQTEQVVWEWIKSILLDTAQMDIGFAEMNNREELEPIKKRIATIEKLLDKHQTKLKKSVGLYLDDIISKDLLEETQADIQKIIDSLKAEQLALTDQLNQQTMTEEQFQQLKATAENLIALGLDSMKFETKREILALMGFRGTLAIEDGLKVIHARCYFDDTRLSLDKSSPIRGSRRDDHPDRGQSQANSLRLRYQLRQRHRSL